MLIITLFSSQYGRDCDDKQLLLYLAVNTDVTVMTNNSLTSENLGLCHK